jgi:hypothetical protein
MSKQNDHPVFYGSFYTVFTVLIFQDLIIFYIVNKQTKTKMQKSWFYKTCVFSAVPSPIDMKLGRDIRTSTRNSVVCLFCLYYCLFTFCKCKQRNHTYGFLGRLFIKCFETW